MPKTNVALVLSGGVSAGSFIAGALDELLRAFKASDRYEIDIITGASAGATTAALIAHGLCYRDGETDLYRVWVEQVDMVELLAPDIGPDDPISVLSPTQLRQLASETISWPPDGGPGERATICAPNLIVAMTLSNATPLAYASRIRMPTSGAEETFVQERNAEQETFVLDEEVGPHDPLWGRIGRVAQASAALPFIFPMVQLIRRAENPLHYPIPPSYTGERGFWYYDGGAFNNLPVDLAWYYISGPEHQGAGALDNRRVVVIDPWRSSLPPVTSDPIYPSLLTYAFNMLRDIRTESSKVEFDNEIVRRSADLKPTDSLTRALPGLPRPPVELLRNFALVIPRLGDPSLRCVYLNHLSAFLDRKFREYDFRRGAAYARDVARDVLEIRYEQRPEAFYHPDADESLGGDISDYAVLDTIASTRDPNRSVRRMFEDALESRIAALVRRFDLPGPDNPLTDAILTRMARTAALSRMPKLWNDG
jgi:hypothetical protein